MLRKTFSKHSVILSFNPYNGEHHNGTLILGTAVFLCHLSTILPPGRAVR